MRFSLIQITGNCNQNCLFCSSPSFNSHIKKEEGIAILSSLTSQEVVFTGGEPTLSPHLFRLIHEAKRKGFKTKIITNGHNFTSLAKKLQDSGLDRVMISLHTLKKETANKLSCLEPTRIERAIKTACTIFEQTQIITVLNQFNMKEMPAMYNYLIRKYPKIPYYVINYIDPVGRVTPKMVPKFSEAEIYLKRSLDILRNKTCDVEFVPLCYLPGHEKKSTEYNDILNKSTIEMYSIKKRSILRGNIIEEKINKRFKYCTTCHPCYFKSSCPGINSKYLDIHGCDEFYPIFHSII